MNEQERKQLIQKTFDTVAEGYDNSALRFFANAAALLPPLFKFQGNEHVLDVATGTGQAACALAPHLPRGRVTGIDFSEAMLKQARARSVAQHFPNTEFLPMDMQAMSFPGRPFDAANCSFGLFFVEDMEIQLKHIAQQVKPGGRIVANAFYESAFLPMIEMFLLGMERYGVQRPPVSWKRMGTEEKSAALFRSAGLTGIHTERHAVGYFLRDAEQWWDIVWFAGFRGMVNQLAPAQLLKFKHEHLAEIQTLAIPEGIKLDVDIVYTCGYVP